MARFLYTAGKVFLGSGLVWTTADIRAFLVKTGSTCPTDFDADFLADFVTLGEHTGAAREQVLNRTLFKDSPGRRAQLRSDPTLFGTVPALGAGEELLGAVYYYDTGNPATDIPLGFTSDGFIYPDGHGLIPYGGPLTLRPSSLGVFLLE